MQGCPGGEEARVEEEVEDEGRVVGYGLGGKGRWWECLRTASARNTTGGTAGDTCSAGFSLCPMSKVTNSSQAAFLRNWVMLLTKIASAWRSTGRGVQGPRIHRSRPKIFLSRDENLYKKQEIGAQLYKW